MDHTHGRATSVLSVIVGVAAEWHIAIAARVLLHHSGLSWLSWLGGLGGLGGLGRVRLRLCRRGSEDSSCKECSKSEVLGEMHVLGWEVCLKGWSFLNISGLVYGRRSRLKSDRSKPRHDED